MIISTIIKNGYKQTELGVIPEDWDVKKLGNVCERITTGKLDANAMSPNGEYPFFTCAKGYYWIDRYDFNDEALLVSGNGANVGYIHYYKGKFNAYQRTYILTGFSEDIQFIKLFMERNLRERIRVEVNAGNTPYIKMDTLTNMDILIPRNKKEQFTIATVLSDVYTLIECLEKLIEKKKNIKQGAMQELLTGNRRLPGFSGKWEIKLLPDVAWFQEGPGVRTSQFTSSGIKLLNGTNIYRGKLLLDSTNRFISESEAYGPYSHFLVDEGDIVIASSGITIDKFEEKVSFVRKEHLPLCMNTSTIRFKIHNNLLDARFLYYFLMSKKFKNQIGAQATGSAQLNFGPSHVKKVEIFLPKDKKEQIAITTIFYDIDAEIEKLESQLAKYQNIKQGMMQQLLTGRIRIYANN